MLRLLTLGRRKAAVGNRVAGGEAVPLAERELLLQALEAQEGWHQIADDRGRLLWAGRSGALGGDPFQPLWIWLRERLADKHEELAQLDRLEEAARLAVPAEALLDLGEVVESALERVRVSVHPLIGPPQAVLWKLEVVPQPVEPEGLLPEALLTSAQLGFYRADREGRLITISETLAHWLGLPEGAAGRRIGFLRDLLFEPAPDSAPGSLLPDPGREGESKGRSGQVLLRCLAGQAFPAEVTELGADEGHSPYRLGLVRRLEAAKGPAEEEILERLSQEAPFGIAHLSPDGRLMSCNRAFAELLEGELEQLLGRGLLELLEESQRQSLQAALERLAQRREEEAAAEIVELRIGQSSQRIASLLLRHLPEVEGLGAYLLDLTEQKALEARAAQSQKMEAIGQLAGGIAHDFNNLLTAMIGFADLLLARHRPGDPSFGEIMQIKQNANRAADLVRQLLAFSRQQSWQPKALRLTDVLEDITHLLRRLIGPNVELEVVHGRDLWLIKSDQGQLEQVVINLAINARDAMGGSGLLEIHTSNLELFEPRKAIGETVPPGDYVLLEVADNGEGIPPENMERIFEPFFSTKEVGEGTGLGLPMVYGIVKQTGGYIALESTLGLGTRVLIYLPRIAEAAVESRKEEKPPVRDLTGRGRLLLVEDEEAVRIFSATALRSKGYEVLEARSGDEALELLQSMGPEESLDLLITDVVMPRVDGPSLVRAARRHRPTLQVIYISGYAEDSLRARLRGEDARARYLPKPFSLRQLAAEVKEAMKEVQ